MDKYTLHARLFPVTVAMLPLVILSVTFSIDLNSYVAALTGVGVSTGLALLMAQIARDAGKTLEKSLWKSWGGPPSTRFLRWSDGTIDITIKEGYHQKLSHFVPELQAPDAASERADSKNADKVYERWSHYLKTRTRDEKFALLLTDNINYGFRRNLLGIRKAALFICIISIIATYCFFNFQVQQDSIARYPLLFFIAEFVFLVIFCIWIFLINSSFVKQSADSYAFRLLESIEQIN